MTAIKKSTTKSKTSPAPATKTAAAAKPAKAAKSAPKKATPVTTAQATAGLAALAAKAVSASPTSTVVSARIDVGFGNALYVRGEGPGLSWDRGVLMNCVAGDLWQLTLGAASRPFVLKFLINDATWSTGPDFTLEPGTSATFTPAF